MSSPDATSRPPVVVGVDGSEPSLAAVDLAAEEATARELPLEIVHAFVLPVMSRPVGITPDLAPVGDLGEPVLRQHAEQVVGSAAERVRSGYPDLPLISRLRDGYPGEILADASHHASMVVVGHRGSGGFVELLTGSVAIQLASHAAAPVIITRGDPASARHGPVVVGVDGSDGSRRAAEFGLGTAAAHGALMISLYAWPVDAAWSPALAQAGHPPPTVPNEVTDTLAVIAHQYPQVTVETEVRERVSAHEALVEASKNARMVVVGSRGRGGFTGLLLGSVSHALINHAHCPVAVIGPEA